jgi:hypothetical protein
VVKAASANRHLWLSAFSSSLVDANLSSRAKKEKGRPGYRSSISKTSELIKAKGNPVWFTQ